MAEGRPRTINETHFRVKAHCDIGNGGALRSLWIEILDYCHLCCPYCFASTDRACPHVPADHLEQDEYLRMLDDFRAGGGEFLGIPGNGEPFHPANRPLVMAILRHASKLGLRTTVFTTADALFWKMEAGRSYEEAVSQDPDFGLMDELSQLDVIFLVKFNSRNPDVQDRLVGQPGYTAARGRAMDWMIGRYRLNSDTRLGIVTSVMPANKDEIGELYEYAEENNLIFDCDTILPRGRGETFVKDQHPGHLGPRECRAVYDALEKLSPERLSTGGSYVGVACDRFRHHLYIDITGNAYTCIGCVGREDRLVLGNVREQPLAAIWDHPIRRQIRERLTDIVFGPCSVCENFGSTCWSCLGRSVERFEIQGDSLLIHTRGCFNHRPDWDKWVARCNEFIYRRLGNVPDDVKPALRSRLEKLGLEAFWQRTPKGSGLGAAAWRFPHVLKDFSLSDLAQPSVDLWRLVEPEVVDDFMGDMESLLPRSVLPSFKLISDGEQDVFRPSAEQFAEAYGSAQFVNLMFYLPHLKRYVYRTITQNSLDAGILSCPEHRSFTRDQAEAAATVRRTLELRNRAVRFWQRWAEAFSRDGKGLILPYIKNLSHDMEVGRVDTYELILDRSLHDRCRLDVDNEVRYQDRRILAIHELIEMPIVRDRTESMRRRAMALVSDDERWAAICGEMSHWSFAHSAEAGGPDFALLKAEYDTLAEEFYPDDLPAEAAASLETELREALIRVLVSNLVPFADTYEKTWYGGAAIDGLRKAGWPALLATARALQGAKTTDDVPLPACLKPGASGGDTLKQRLRNKLLDQFMRLFIAEDGSLGVNWHRAVNYFVWLAFFREHLGVGSYFVHHAPNIRRHFDILEEIPEQAKHLKDPVPSGMIVSSSGRLSLQSRECYQAIFSQIMVPIEGLIQTGLFKEEYSRIDQSQKQTRALAEARKMALGHLGHQLKGRLDSLQSFLDQHGEEGLSGHVRMLSDLTVILQLHTVDDRAELLALEPRKRKRFLDYGDEPDSRDLDLLSRVTRDWPELVAGERVFEEDGRRLEAWSGLDMRPLLSSAVLGFPLKDRDGRPCRLKEAVYRELLFELLLNIRRYGFSRRVPGESRGNLPVVAARCDVTASQLGDRSLLVLTNEVNAEKSLPGYLRAAEWQKWPEDRKYDGPGMALTLLRRLKLGDMFFRRHVLEDGREFFLVGLHLTDVVLG